MTPEQLAQFEQMQATITELQGKVDAIYNASNIPYEVEQSIRTRFDLGRIDTLASIEVSSKGATSENQSVNEAGVATYSVLKAPVRWTKIVVDGVEGQLPTYNT